MIKWNPADYARQSSHQQAWARELIAKLNLTGRESVLDVGCGDGKVTAELAGHLPAGQVVGIDSSPEMVAFAAEKFAGQKNLRFVVADAGNLPFENQFNLVFSNAALHWISDHRPVLAGIRRSLKTSGRILLQMGGKGNASQLIAAIQPLMRREDWLPYFRDFDFRYGFHGPGEYRLWLSDASLRPTRMELIPKVMLHESAAAFAGWLRTTWMPYIHPVSAPLRERWISEIVDRYLVGHPADADGCVSVRMVRLEVEAEAV
jgi:trans-aconitate 2-methyltransferase